MTFRGNPGPARDLACHDVGMTPTETGPRRGLMPLLLLSVVVVLVSSGLAHGVWLPNLHNGLLGLAFTFVGAYVLFQRPGHREGLLLMATGLVESVMFFGRQIGHVDGGNTWLGWLGVWPVAVGIGLVSLSVICFPNGRLPSSHWRRPVAVAAVVVTTCAAASALWPVEYGATGVVTRPPLHLGGADAVSAVWTPVAHATYAVLQLVWVVAVVARWRSSGRLVRVQLTWVGLPVVVSAVLLVIGVVFTGSPRAGLLSAALVPVAAGWSIVHAQHLAAYSALSWLSRAGSQDMPDDLARALAEAFDAPAATVWMGPPTELHPVGVWPEQSLEPMDLDTLSAGPGLTRAIVRDGVAIGAVRVDRTGTPSLAENRLLDDVAAQAVLVIEHLALLRDAARRRATADLGHLSPREREVLGLMARGLSNAAICAQLHLSVKTVEPAVSSIFTKLGLSPDTASNRRVLAVLAFLKA